MIIIKWCMLHTVAEHSNQTYLKLTNAVSIASICLQVVEKTSGDPAGRQDVDLRRRHNG